MTQLEILLTGISLALVISAIKLHLNYKKRIKYMKDALAEIAKASVEMNRRLQEKMLKESADAAAHAEELFKRARKELGLDEVRKDEG